MFLLSFSFVVTSAVVLVAQGSFFQAGTRPHSPIPLVSVHNQSQASCAVTCDWYGSDCDGFTLAEDGTCLPVSTACEARAAPEDAAESSYFRKMPDQDSPCRGGWLFGNNSCYLRQEVRAGVDFSEARLACQSLGSAADLLSLNGLGKRLWMRSHCSKSFDTEYIGMTWTSGHLINVDGSTPEHTTHLAQQAGAADGCVATKEGDGPKSLQVIDCSTALTRFICEEPPLCAPRSLCPEGWFGLDGYCYHYVDSGASWLDAEDNCLSLQMDAMLAPLPNIGVWSVLRDLFGIKADVWLGIRDLAGEASFESVDDTVWHLPWVEGSPNSLVGDENDCVLVVHNQDAIDDFSCSAQHHSICRVPLGLC